MRSGLPNDIPRGTSQNEYTIMLLALDLGNTNLTIGVYNNQNLVESWRIETVHSRTEDEYALVIRQLFEFSGLQTASIQAVILASVVPVLTPTIVALCNRVFKQRPLVVGPGTRTGISIRYDPPKDVGADRIVNAVAAYNRFKSACIIVDFGTATTFDSVLKDGIYAGGAIVPGIQVSMGALFSRASKLPKVDFGRPDRVVGKTTVESIQSGLYYGYAALVDGLVCRMRTEMSQSVSDVPSESIRVIATGGLAPSLAQDTSAIELVDEHLTLEGLRMIHEFNSPSEV